MNATANSLKSRDAVVKLSSYARTKSCTGLDNEVHTVTHDNDAIIIGKFQ